MYICVYFLVSEDNYWVYFFKNIFDVFRVFNKDNSCRICIIVRVGLIYLVCYFVLRRWVLVNFIDELYYSFVSSFFKDCKIFFGRMFEDWF